MGKTRKQTTIQCPRKPSSGELVAQSLRPTFVAGILRETPYYDLQEWFTALQCLFSSSSDDLRRGIELVNVWKLRSRSLSIATEYAYGVATVNLLDRGRDPQPAVSPDAIVWMLCFHVIRLTNGVCEFVWMKARRTRRKQYINKAGYTVQRAADLIGYPAELVNLRHQATHGRLPSLSDARRLANVGLEFLRQNYWTPLSEQVQQVLQLDHTRKRKRNAVKPPPSLPPCTNEAHPSPSELWWQWALNQDLTQQEGAGVESGDRTPQRSLEQLERCVEELELQKCKQDTSEQSVKSSTSRWALELDLIPKPIGTIVR